jgi:hypothetical protein
MEALSLISLYFVDVLSIVFCEWFRSVSVMWSGFDLG